jgi:hypothetical protein
MSDLRLLTSKAVIKIALTLGSIFFIFATNSTPFISGILTSDITKENFFGFSLKYSSAKKGLLKTSTLNPSNSKSILTKLAISILSSITNISELGDKLIQSML